MKDSEKGILALVVIAGVLYSMKGDDNSKPKAKAKPKPK